MLRFATAAWPTSIRDEAGETAAAALASELIESGLECSRVLFPKGMDANEYALKVTPAEKSLAVLLNSAEWLGGKPQPSEEPQPAPTPEPPAPGQGDEAVLTFEDRRYRVRGLAKNLSYDLLRVPGNGGSNVSVPSPVQFTEIYAYTQPGLTSKKRL